jgi:hypothetical protein
MELHHSAETEAPKKVTKLFLNRPLPHSRLGYPRSGLSRSDFVPWHFSDVQPDSGMSAFRGRAEGVIASPDYRV